MLANEAAAYREGGVVVACGRLVVDDDGASGPAALRANHFPAVVLHPLREARVRRSHEQQCHGAPYSDKVRHPRYDGVARAASSHRAAGEFGAKALGASAVGLRVGDGGTGVITGGGVDHDGVGDERWDGDGAGCGDEAEHNKTTFDHSIGGYEVTLHLRLQPAFERGCIPQSHAYRLPGRALRRRLPQ